VTTPEYDARNVTAGMATVMVGVIVYTPEAEAAAIEKNLTAVGAVTAAAGMAIGGDTVLVREACIQFTPAAPPAVQTLVVPVIVEAVTGMV
jgi:hypothetical protein